MLKDKYDFDDLVEIMNILRGEGGCPWDREQTHETLKQYLIEETYEVLEAIDLKSREKLCEELGDLLLQIVFHARIAMESKNFDINDVITGICKKMMLRHTHIFGEDTAKTSEEVLINWEQIKKKEKGIKSYTQSMNDIPSNLPALMRSYKVTEKAAKAGFDWEKVDEVYSKIYEEINELKAACVNEDSELISDELGDVLFSIVNLARFIKVNPELALSKTTEKFIRRFEFVEEKAKKIGKKLDDMPLEEMELLWEEAKKSGL